MNWNGVSNVRMSAGTFNFGGTAPQLILGATTYGSAELSGTAVWNYTHTDNLGAARFSARRGYILQTGGAINANYTGGSGGILGGTEFILGNGGTDRAVMYSSGGTVTINTGVLTGSALVIGDTLTANGGSDLTITGTADWTLTGPAGNVRITRTTANHAGNLNLKNGGRLTTRSIIMGSGNAGRLNFDGGILRAGISTTTFLQGLTSARIYAGGATIDTDDFDITIGQALLAPTGNVVQSIAVLTGGSGYLGAPIVTIIEGSGAAANTSATAIANYDAATGTVTGITITNPGSGFTNPTVSLFGGTSGTAATLGPITLTTATSGGLNKIGSGTLTLTGVNTYTGVTTVSDGTLALSINGSFAASTRIVVGTSAGSSAVLNANALTGGANFIATDFTLAAGQTLAGHGTVNASSVGFAAPTGTTIAPGTSAGTLAITGDSVIGGTYNFELAIAGTGSAIPVSNGASSPGLPHANHDVLAITGSVDVTGMIVNITSLDTPGTGFDNTKYYSWTILTSTGLTGTPTFGTVSGNEFSNPGIGFFSVSTDSTSVYLNFSPVPEPRWILAIALLCIGMVGYCRKLRSKLPSLFFSQP